MHCSSLSQITLQERTFLGKNRRRAQQTNRSKQNNSGRVDVLSIARAINNPAESVNIFHSDPRLLL
jgi:hypothetical protein